VKSKVTPGKVIFGVYGFLVGRSWSVKGLPGMFNQGGHIFRCRRYVICLWGRER